MRVFRPNYFTYVSPLAGMLGILVFFPTFLYVAFKYNDYLFTIISLLVLVLGYSFINYLLVNVKELKLTNTKLFIFTSIGNIISKTYEYQKIEGIKLTKLYVNTVLFEVKRKPLAKLKNSWLTQVPQGYLRRPGGEIKYYLTIQNRDSDLEEFLLTGYTTSTMEKLILELKEKLGDKFIYDNYLIKQGYPES